MKTNRVVSAVAVCLFAAAAFAGGLSKYKGWDKTPQGYFMTPDERTLWASIRDDADAEKFVNEFLAKRGPQFADEVTKAAVAADKYLTVGKTQGSLSERGKLIVLLGPPASLSFVKREARTGDLRSNSSSPMASGATAGGGSTGTGQGATVADMMSAATGPGNTTGWVNVYTFTYPADKLPAAYGKPLTVDIEVDNSGKDKVPDRGVKAELDRLYDLAVQAKLNPPAPKRP
jgi:hypothetical protein